MIESMEIWDFESHEHTLIENFSPGLNLICGDSNVGKSSILRALKVICYNQFDQASVRLGANNCRIRVTTERGTVKVTKGINDNLWEVTPKGQKTQIFDKVGVKIIPEAVAILGLNVVTLGDIKVPINIMDQLESHFMLSSIGDKDASGSMRAQIVDEISGLSGIEGLIKSVSLDHLRLGKDIAETEKKMEEARKQLYPESELLKEEFVLHQSEKDISDYNEMIALADEGTGIFDRWKSEMQVLDALTLKLKNIPDTQKALNENNKAKDLCNQVISSEQITSDYKTCREHFLSLKRDFDAIPDIERARICSVLSDTNLIMLEKAETLLHKFAFDNSIIRSKQNRINKLSEALKAKDEIVKADTAISLTEKAEICLKNNTLLVEKIVCLAFVLKDILKQIEEWVNDRDEILKTITTCPLTLKPVSPECLKETGDALKTA